MPETLVLEFNPNFSLGAQIRGGRYDYVNPAIKAGNIQLTLPAGKREVVLYDDPRGTTSEEVIDRMVGDGLKPATLDDCLAMGQQHPNRQRVNPLVFLGSVWRDPGGYRRVPVLYGRNDGRRLCLGWFFSGWSSSFRFAAVRQK